MRYRYATGPLEPGEVIETSSEDYKSTALATMLTRLGGRGGE